MESGHTQRLAAWLDLANQQQTDVREEIIAHACDRLRQLTHRMLKHYPRVKRWLETDDVLQNAMMRLHRSLLQVQPETPRQFYGLAATQIRRELIDLARKQYGPQGIGANQLTDFGERVKNKSDDSEPESLDSWSQFHLAVENLPEDQQEVVNLLWYEGISQPDAASLLNISLATLKRRWQAARLTLGTLLKDF
jgi:RNA polymerase sigma factor (sigma-70 family)